MGGQRWPCSVSADKLSFRRFHSTSCISKHMLTEIVLQQLPTCYVARNFFSLGKNNEGDVNPHQFFIRRKSLLFFFSPPPPRMARRDPQGVNHPLPLPAAAPEITALRTIRDCRHHDDVALSAQISESRLPHIPSPQVIAI